MWFVGKKFSKVLAVLQERGVAPQVLFRLSPDA
jgi:hypothetical protein